MSLGLSLSLALGASAHGSPFTPASIPGLVWWLRADMGVTISSGVQSWADQSGIGDTGRNATDFGATLTHPAFVASDAGFGGKPTIGPFTAAGNCRLRTATSWSATYSTYSILVVGSSQATSNRYFCLPSAANYASPVNKLGVAKGFAGTTPKEIPAGVKSLTNPTYALIEYDFTAGLNGKTYVGQTATPDGTLDISAEPILLGALGLHVGGHPNNNIIFNVDQMAEIAAWNRIMTAPERALIALYMSRYGF